MTEIIELETSRLRLRQWRQEDFPAFASLNADAEAMQFYSDVLSTEESNVLGHKFESLISDRGWGFWAVELKESKKFIGFVGLNEPAYKLPVTPCVEVGWRMAKIYWGNGYATEAANAVLAVAFENIGLSEVFAFTPVSNKKSLAVMVRLGMIDTSNNFEHPLVPENSSLSLHALYKIDKQYWLKIQQHRIS